MQFVVLRTNIALLGCMHFVTGRYQDIQRKCKDNSYLSFLKSKKNKNTEDLNNDKEIYEDAEDFSNFSDLEYMPNQWYDPKDSKGSMGGSQLPSHSKSARQTALDVEEPYESRLRGNKYKKHKRRNSYFTCDDATMAASTTRKPPLESTSKQPHLPPPIRKPPSVSHSRKPPSVSHSRKPELASTTRKPIPVPNEGETPGTSKTKTSEMHEVLRLLCQAESGVKLEDIEIKKAQKASNDAQQLLEGTIKYLRDVSGKLKEAQEAVDFATIRLQAAQLKLSTHEQMLYAARQDVRTLYTQVTEVETEQGTSGKKGGTEVKSLLKKLKQPFCTSGKSSGKKTTDPSELVIPETETEGIDKFYLARETAL